jgi:hypothetical protein
VLVPLRGIAEWLGAQVSYQAPVITVALDGRTLVLRLNSRTATVAGQTVTLDVPAREYGGITCVPVRFVSEGLGVGVTYKSEQCPTSADVLLQAGDREARVLVHSEPPNVVAKVIGDLEHTRQTDAAYPEITLDLGAYGTDWVMEVGRVRGGYFRAPVPACWDDSMGDGGCFFSNAWAVYGQRDGAWRLLISGQDMPSRKAWARAGIPVEIARQLGVALSSADY